MMVKKSNSVPEMCLIFHQDMTVGLSETNPQSSILSYVKQTRDELEVKIVDFCKSRKNEK